MPSILVNFRLAEKGSNDASCRMLIFDTTAMAKIKAFVSSNLNIPDKFSCDTMVRLADEGVVACELEDLLCELLGSLETGIPVHLPEWDNAKQPASLDVHICRADQSCMYKTAGEYKAENFDEERPATITRMEDSPAHAEAVAPLHAILYAWRERQSIKKMEGENWPMKLGAARYLVGSSWFEAWLRYASDQNTSSEGRPPPGPINNSLLVGRVDSSELRPNLQEDQDYIHLCEPAWRALQQLHGGGPAIARSVVRDKGCLRVEVYLLQLTALRSSAPQQKLPIQLSKGATVADLKEAVCAAHKLNKADVQLWDYFQGSYYGNEPLDTQPDATLSQAGVLDKQLIMLLEKGDNGNFPKVKSRGLST